MIPMREVRLGFMSAIESYNYQKIHAIQTAIIGVVDFDILLNKTRIWILL